MLFFAFDLLYRDGFDLRALPLLDRKRALAEVLSKARGNKPMRILYSEHFTDGSDLFDRAGGMDLEGIVSKRADGAYGWRITARCAGGKQDGTGALHHWRRT
jgi:bifunctional non-homologous end joining protein LigD